MTRAHSVSAADKPLRRIFKTGYLRKSHFHVRCAKILFRYKINRGLIVGCVDFINLLRLQVYG